MEEQFVAKTLTFSARDFRVPRHYLHLIVGNPATPQQSGAHGHGAQEQGLSTLAFVDQCIQHFKDSGSETWAGAPKVPVGTFSLIIAAAGQGANFADALKRAAHATELLRPEVHARFHQTRRSIALTITPRQTGPAAEIGIEFLLISLHCSLRWLFGRQLPPLQLRAAELCAERPVSLLRILSCPMQMRGTGITIHYPRTEAKRPLAGRRYDCWAAQELPEFRQLLEEAAQSFGTAANRGESPFVDRIKALLKNGYPTERELSAYVGMSPASFRRRLAECGTHFRALQDNLRREQVRCLLRTEKQLATIASDAGFSDVRSLRRACVRWFGTPPGVIRSGTTAPNPVTKDTSKTRAIFTHADAA